MIKSVHKKIAFWSFVLLLLSVPTILLGTRIKDPLTCNVNDQLVDTKLDSSSIRINAQGTALLNNKPFFPMGFYHVSSPNTSNERRKHLRMIADAGFNTIHVSFDTIDAPTNKSGRIDYYKQFLQEAETLGIKVLTEFDPRERLMLIDDLKTQPAILGWNIADDVDNGRLTPANVLRSHCQLKQIDSRHLTYISGYSEENIADYVNTADIVGVQAYPVGDNRNPPFSWPNQMVSLADNAADPDRLIISNVQLFRWDKGNPAAVENPPIPTFEQIRNMTYQSLVAGAKGIIFFAAYAKDWNILEHPELWQKTQTLVPEINQLEPILLEGKLEKLEVETEDILAGVWTLKEEKLAIIVNTSEQDITNVTLNLPGNKVQSMFDDRVEEVRLDRGNLTYSLDALGVRVYKIFP
jgi:hypothetical protein